MPSSLIQEHHITIPSSLAATIGLEETVLLQIMSDCLKHRPVTERDGYDWVCLPRSDALRLMPFWNEEQIERISRHLQSLGIIRLASASLLRADQLEFALSETERSTSRDRPPPRRGQSADTDTADQAHSAPRQPLHQPDLAAIAPSNRSPLSSAHAEPGFDSSRRPPAPTERAISQSDAPAPQGGHAPLPSSNARRGAVPMHDNWQPNRELLRKLQEFHGIPPEFANDLVPEFIVYWRDRRSATFSWEARFMSHANRQWQHEQARRQEPVSAAAPASGAKGECAMSDLWQPSEDAVAILERSGIEAQFIQDAVPEFILYWRDRGDISNTWDSRFIAHIRRQWSRFESSMQYGQSHGKTHQSAAEPDRRSFVDKHTDKSWRDGL